jgi:hypothetical protein
MSIAQMLEFPEPGRKGKNASITGVAAQREDDGGASYDWTSMWL